MHGLINRSIQCFLRDTYGASTWAEIATAADLGFDGFEAMLEYDDEVTRRVLLASSRNLDKRVSAILEDIGTYLVSHPNVENLRRLLRFGGETYVDFLQSLNELRGRSQLALPDIDVPAIEVRETGEGRFHLTCRFREAGFGYAVMGVLRAMADDYGALVYLEHHGAQGTVEELSIHLLEAAFAQGRSFELAARTAEGAA